VFRRRSEAPFPITPTEQARHSGACRLYRSLPRAIRASSLKSLDDELIIERDLMRELGRSADYQEGVAAFMAKRAPVFTGC